MVSAIVRALLDIMRASPTHSRTRCESLHRENPLTPAPRGFTG